MEEYSHKESFALMQYQNKRTGEIEVLWNSRDGVTPFGIRSRDGQDEMSHVNWREDKCMPDRKPEPGNRIFVNLELEHALPFAREYVNLYWEGGKYQMKDHPLYGLMSKEEAVGYHAASTVDDGCRPHVLTVTEEWLTEQEDRKKATAELLERLNRKSA
jgi:hypothetical protein